jgi:hypothetical protein
MNLLGKPTVEFCEKAGTGIIKRPFYALSNLAYVFVGIYIWQKKTKLSKWFGGIAVFIGLASFFYDASYTYISQLIDLFGMFLFVKLLIYLSAKRLFQNRTRLVLLLQILLLLLGLIAIVYFKSFSGEYVFGAFIMIEIILEMVLWFQNKTKNIGLLVWATLVFLLGFAIWIPDATGYWCNPFDFLNGRGVFHILTSITIYLLYLFFEKQEN